MKSVRLFLPVLVAGSFALAMAPKAEAQYPLAVVPVQPVAPVVVGYTAQRRGLFGRRIVYRPVVAAAPVAQFAPVTAARPVLAPVTVARPVFAPVTVARPVVVAPAPVAVPVTTYRVPTVPVVPVQTYRYRIPVAPIWVW